MAEQQTRRKGSLRLLGETEQEYYKHCLLNIADAKEAIRLLNEAATNNMEISELCAQSIEHERQIIRKEMERIRAEKNG